MAEVIFEGLSKKFRTIKIDGKDLKIQAKRKHAEMFSTLSRDYSEKDAARITDMMIEMIKNANPEAAIEDIEAFTVENYGKILAELAPIFGFATREEVQRKLAELKGTSGKKIGNEKT